MEQTEAITRKSSSNLALAFILLPKPKREGMAALYAFCREVDDVADEESHSVEKRREGLQAWRDDVRRACQGERPRMGVNQELQPVIQQYRLPFELFDELIVGCEADLETVRYEDYAGLEQYCYRVASVVGLLSIEIFGYTDPKCRDYAVHLGQALQLTNILRDVKVDAERGRIYLPLEELRRFKVAEQDILRGNYTPEFRELAFSVGQRARFHYAKARELLPAVDRKNMIAAELMGSVYWRLLAKLEQRQFNVFGPTLTKLTKLQKIALILRTWFRLSSGALTPNYGPA